jgi:excisionase family DNA binding protein
MSAALPPPDAVFLSVEEAAALLRIGRNQMYQAIARGEVRGVKRIGKTIRVRRSALLADDPEHA